MVMNSLSFCLSVDIFNSDSFFWPYPQHMKIPEPRIELVPPQQPKLLSKILNPLHHTRNSSLINFWRSALAGEICLVDSFFLSALWVYYSTLSLPARFLQRNSLSYGNSFINDFFSLWLSKFSLCLIFEKFYFNVSPGSLLWVESALDLGASFTWMTLSFLRFGKFSAIIF